MKARFSAFVLDRATRELRAADQLIRISPKAFDLLALLVDRRPAAVSKDELHAALWPGTFVSDGALAVLVNEVRRALGDSARSPRFVRTVNRFGYAFSHVTDAAPDAGPSASPCMLIWSGERARLKAGANVLGRDPDADVFIDAVGVSRRHALLVVGPDRATIADLGSKNGTSADGAVVRAAVPLRDGAEILLGPLRLRFHRARPTPRTETVAGRTERARTHE